MSTIGQRLKNTRKKILQISREKFVEGLSISTKTLENYENDGTSPDANFFTLLWGKYHDQLSMSDLDWIMWGKRMEYEVATTTPVLGRVPAGFPENIAEEDILEYISMPGAPKEAYSLIIDGNSMAPDIKDGDYVIFLPAERTSTNPGDIVVINDEFGQSMIKRYVLKDGQPYLKSDNPEYPGFEPNEHYTVIGKVIDVWSRKKIRSAP